MLAVGTHGSGLGQPAVVRFGRPGEEAEALNLGHPMQALKQRCFAGNSTMYCHTFHCHKPKGFG